MTSLIESLIGTAVRRMDEKRIAPVQRPLPERPRDIFDIFSAMGGEATMSNLKRSLDLNNATARWMTAVVLDRWPTLAELEAEPEPYDARRHLRDLIQSVEFRHLLAQRIITTFPEKRRILFVRIPQCAGAHFLQLAETMHPIFPDRLASPRAPQDFFPALGQHLGRYLHTRSIMLVQPRMDPFFHAPVPVAPAAPDGDTAEGESLPWTMASPPYRPSDRLFTIVRDPEDIILGQVNSIAVRLHQNADDDAAFTRQWQRRLQSAAAAADSDDAKTLARRVFAVFPHADPICTALGDGTAERARENCIVTNVEIADLSRFDEWILRTWDTKPQPAAPSPPAILTRDDLTPADVTRLAALTVQDRPFYARIKALISGATLSSITGSQL